MHTQGDRFSLQYSPRFRVLLLHVANDGKVDKSIFDIYPEDEFRDKITEWTAYYQIEYHSLQDSILTGNGLTITNEKS